MESRTGGEWDRWRVGLEESGTGGEWDRWRVGLDECGSGGEWHRWRLGQDRLKTNQNITITNGISKTK